MLSFLFLRQHIPQRLYNIEFGGQGSRELTLDANKIEVLQYRKAGRDLKLTWEGLRLNRNKTYMGDSSFSLDVI